MIKILILFFLIIIILWNIVIILFLWKKVVVPFYKKIRENMEETANELQKVESKIQEKVVNKDWLMQDEATDGEVVC